MQKKLGILNSIPAGMIDRIYRDYPKGWFGRILAAIKIRIIYAFLFLPLSVLDLGVNALKSIVNFIGVMVRSDDIQDKRLNSFKNNASLFSKNLYALLACIFGFFNPKLVTFYFTPELAHDSGVSAGGDYYHAKNAVLIKASFNIYFNIV